MYIDRMVLILIRHAQSIYNKRNIVAGSTKDIGLTEEGKMEAYDVGKLLNKYKFDYIFTSELKRATDTCKIINGELNCNPEIIYSNKLNERNFGFLAGHEKRELENIYSTESVRKWLVTYDGIPPNGESIHDTRLRIGNYFNTYIQPILLENKNVLLITHSSCLKALFVHLGLKNKTSIEDFSVSNCVPIKIDIENKKYKFDN